MQSEHENSSTTESADKKVQESGFVGRILITYTLGALFLLLAVLLWFASSVVLLVFASILMAVLLHDACSKVEKRLRVPRGVALILVLLAVIALIVLAGWLLAPQVIEQTNQLIADIPRSMQRLREVLERNRVLQYASRYLPSPERMADSTGAIVAQAGSVFSGVFGVLGNIAIFLFLGIYLASQPSAYTDGIVKLLPIKKRARGQQVLHEIGETLSLWLKGKLLSMAIVGAVTAIGLMLLGVPLSLALGVLAGLLDFIPYIGPILAAIPAILIAFSNGPLLALYVVLLFVALQMLEGYLLLPLVERKTVSLPPALTIIMQVLMGLAFGLTGVALVTPLTAVATLLIAMLYVQDVLGDQVTLPAEQKEKE